MNFSQNLGKEQCEAFGKALDRAASAAAHFRGATAPNPPVGAVLLGAEGQVLATGAHERAGTAHAEVVALESARNAGILSQAQTLVVTLEPCNHQGRTGPCTEAILASPVRRVVFAESDPNPRAQGGADRLRSAGLEVLQIEHAPSRELVQPFFHWLRTGRPWVTLKIARRVGLADESRSHPDAMIPDPGQKTFTSPESLRFAHELRRRADAILTGSGTILADHPEFTVRHVADHVLNPQKRRILVILDRRGRVPLAEHEAAQARGFEVVTFSKPSDSGAESSAEFHELMEFLGQKGVHEVLVEAGPQVTTFVESSALWNERFVIEQNVSAAGRPERIVHDVYRNR